MGGGNIGGWVIDMEQVVSGVPAEEALVFNDPVDPGGLAAVGLNGQGVLVTSGAGSLRLWDVDTGEQIIQIPVATLEPPFAVFTAAGDELLYIDKSNSDYVLRRFSLDSEKLITLAESRVTRGFTAAECRRYELSDQGLCNRSTLIDHLIV